MGSVHAEVIRADAAERELRRANRILARLLQMADSWDEQFGDGLIRATVAAGAIREAIRREAP